MYSWFILILTFSNVFSQLTTKTTTTLSPLKSTNNKPSITQFLVFSTDSETIIPFEPKNGWMISEEKKLRLYISGSNLENSSIVFSASPIKCTTSDFISPTYDLSSASIIERNVNIKGASKVHSSIHLCLLSSLKSNETQSQNGTRLDGPYFTFLREKSRLPFAAKICLILMLFIVSGFFR